MGSRLRVARPGRRPAIRDKAGVCEELPNEFVCVCVRVCVCACV